MLRRSWCAEGISPIGQIDAFPDVDRLAVLDDLADRFAPVGESCGCGEDCAIEALADVVGAEDGNVGLPAAPRSPSNIGLSS